MPSSVPPLVVSVKYQYDKTGIKQAQEDIKQFSDNASTGITKVKGNYKQLVDIYSGIVPQLDTTNTKIQNGMDTVSRSITAAQKAMLTYEKSIKAVSTASLSYIKIRNSIENQTVNGKKINQVAKDGTVMTRGGAKHTGAYAENIDLTAKLVAANNRLESSQKSKKAALLSYQQAVNSVASSERKLLNVQTGLNDASAKTQLNLKNIANGSAEVSKSSDTLTTKLAKIRQLLKGIKITSLLAYLYTLKRLFSFASTFIEASSSWIENLNLLEVTFAETADEAKDFVSMAADNFGMDKNALAEYVSTFKQMANAMGQASETGEQMSEALTLIALDVASLRNKDVSTVISDFTSALAGQVKPVRKYGFDITMYSIDELMSEQGYGSYSRTMSQQQKQLARAILLIRQSRDAWGDLAKTINTYENQQRILNDQVTTFKRLLGNAFLGTVQVGDSLDEASQSAGIATKALWYLNAAMMTANTMLGILVPETESFNTTTIATEAEVATDAIDELDSSINASLASFDKFNTMSTAADAAGDSGITATLDALLNSEYENYIARYNEQLKSINMYAKDISDDMLKIIYADYNAWSKNVDNVGKSFEDWKEETGQTNESLQTTFKDLSRSLMGLVSLIAALKSPMAAIAVLSTQLFIENKAFRANMISLAEVTSDFLLTLGDSFANILAMITPFVKFFTNLSAVILKLFNAVDAGTFVVWGLIGALLVIKGLKMAVWIAEMTAKLKLYNITLTATKTLMIAGFVSAIVIIADLIANWDSLSTAGKTFRFILLGIIALFAVLKARNVIVSGLTALFKVLNVSVTTTTINLGSLVKMLGGIAVLAAGIYSFASAFEEMSKGARVAIPVVASLLGLLAGALAVKTGLVTGLAGFIGAAGVVAGMTLMIGTTISKSVSGYADGGYQTGGLFYAGESGAEWVGRQGSTSTILNDSQMSDIMMEAVANGVRIGNLATPQQKQSKTPIVVNVDGRKLFEVVEENGKSVGKTLVSAR